MITLLTKYAAYVKTEAFRVQSERFRDHAIRYRDRWQSLLCAPVRSVLESADLKLLMG
jgi:hypothetical protein